MCQHFKVTVFLSVKLDFYINLKYLNYFVEKQCSSCFYEAK